MCPDELDKCDAPGEIESNDHPKIASSDFKSSSFAIQNSRIWSGQTNIIHGIPFGCFDQHSPTMKRRFRLRMPVGVRRKDAPCDDSHARYYVPKLGTLQDIQKRRGNNPAVIRSQAGVGMPLTCRCRTRTAGATAAARRRRRRSRSWPGRGCRCACRASGLQSIPARRH
jgi:hypothetical protein